MGYIKINKNSFFHNLDYFSKICTKDKLCIALKDNAYGHGTYEMATLCEQYGIKHVFVRTLQEANIASKFNFESILVLYEIPQYLQSDLIISINRLQDLKKLPQGSKCEIKIDTGMNRNGIVKDEIDLAVEYIKENKLILNGVFTHFCCADEDDKITKKQEELFLYCVDRFKSLIDYNFRTHCANSAGAHKVDMSKYDLARIGIGAYGYLDILNKDILKPVMSLHAKKVSTKYINKNDHVGYGSKAFVAPYKMTVSNYDIGYGDSFFRFDENKQAFIADGRKILGRVSMDSFSVEGEDDEIVVFDDVSSLANSLNTITYTILTMLKANIPRYIK